ncbi:DUF6514 family protein [Clostridium paraputrificum]|uniref:DUF6514 family protein n=1 Tax=Clostridium TaxID=1485 RepID=UPI003D33B299
MVVENLLITRSINSVEMKYTYKLTKRNYEDVQAYGIEIERNDMKNGKIINIVKDSVDLISTQRHKVKELLDMLYKNEVSPIHLVDIIGSYVDEYVYDFDNISIKASNQN